jgi:hypothetical protein
MKKERDQKLSEYFTLRVTPEHVKLVRYLQKCEPDVPSQQEMVRRLIVRAAREQMVRDLEKREKDLG